MKHEIPVEVQERISYNLAYLRRKKELTLGEVSRRTGYSINYLSLLENGHRGINVGGLCNLANLYDAQPGQIIDDDFGG